MDRGSKKPLTSSMLIHILKSQDRMDYSFLLYMMDTATMAPRY